MSVTKTKRKRPENIKPKRLVMSDNVAACIRALWDEIDGEDKEMRLMYHHSLIINEAQRREKEPEE
jgi:hypothetical protein